MKLHGKKVNFTHEELIIFPRGEGNDIVFKARAVLDYTDFEKLCPMPKPPLIQRPGSAPAYNTEDAKYKSELDAFAEHRSNWMILKSLEATPGLEWETVDMANPATWASYMAELKESMLTDYEIGQLLKGIMVANGLNEEKIKEARERFLATQAKKENG